jgi:8-oxo-dGTP pyrophosphatase MutT (NUDIX family)
MLNRGVKPESTIICMAMSQNFDHLIDRLTGKLKLPLPGEAAHQDMEACFADYLHLHPNAQTRRSAVLMLLYSENNKIYFPLILRSNYDGFHSGEIGFPGGSYETGDGDLIQTALRETREELGIKSDGVKILGVLTEIFIGPSNFFVLPVIGYLSGKPEFLPDDREVGHVFEISLDYISDPDILGLSRIEIPGDQVLTPHYQVEGYKIWGATAKIIRELLMVLGDDLGLSKD